VCVRALVHVYIIRTCTYTHTHVYARRRVGEESIIIYILYASALVCACTVYTAGRTASGFGVCVGGGCDRGGCAAEGNSERILERRARASETERCVCVCV